MAKPVSRLMGYEQFLKGSEKPAQRPAIWKWTDVEADMMKSLDDNNFLREGRGAVSLVHEDTGDALGICSTLNMLVQVFEPGVRNAAHRHSNFALFIVKEGSGYSLIDGKRIDWEAGDVFFAPAWAAHEHCNSSSTNRAVLYTVQNVPEVSSIGASFFEQPIGSAAKHVIAETD